MAGRDDGLVAKPHDRIVLLDHPGVAAHGRTRRAPALANRGEHEPDRGDDQNRCQHLHACLLRLRGESTRAHAARVRGAIALVVLLVLVETVERAAAGADDATDGRALAGALAAAGDRAARGTDRRADNRPDRAVLDDFHRLVLRAGLARRVLVARVDRALARRGGSARHPRGGRLLHLLLRLLLLRGTVTAGPVRDDQAGHEGGGDHHRHADRRHFPWIHSSVPPRPGGLPEVTAAAVRVNVAVRRCAIARASGVAGEGPAAARGFASGRDDRRARRPRRLVVARHHLPDVLVGNEALGAQLPEDLLPARAALLHRGDLVERERLRTVRAPRGRRARRRRGRRLAGALRRRRRRHGLRLEQRPRDLLV